MNQLAQVGKIKSIQLRSGEILVRETDIMDELSNEELKELEGNPIGISEASRKYKIPHQTLSRWKDRGYLTVMYTQGQKILLDESSVYKQVLLYRQNPGQGQWTMRKANKAT